MDKISKKQRSYVMSRIRGKDTIIEVTFRRYLRAMGIRGIDWNLKEPPVAIETCAVVTDSGLFARTTLEQLRIALAEPKRWVGWAVPQLIDRLAQVGVQVTLEANSKV
jgi:hypothetical protein